jgi:hypothetical protein
LECVPGTNGAGSGRAAFFAILTNIERLRHIQAKTGHCQPMPKRHFNILLPVVIVIVALPAAASLLYYKLTGDPTLRPLGVTLASLTENNIEGYNNGITVQIDWGAGAQSPNTRTQVKAALQKAMSIYPVDFQVRLTETAGDTVQVFFLIDSSRIGPYSLGNVASGIEPALAAYNLGR